MTRKDKGDGGQDDATDLERIQGNLDAMHDRGMWGRTTPTAEEQTGRLVGALHRFNKMRRRSLGTEGRLPRLEVEDLQEKTFPSTPQIRTPPANRRWIHTADAGTTRTDATSDAAARRPDVPLSDTGPLPDTSMGMPWPRQHLGEQGGGWGLLPTPLGVAVMAYNTAHGLFIDTPAAIARLVQHGYMPGDERNEQAIADALTASGVAATGGFALPKAVGSLGMFGGRLAAENLAKAGRPTALEAINMAEAMSKRGLSDLAVREHINDFIAAKDPKLGGVDRDATGQWRFEFSDEAARLTGKPKAKSLGEYIEHPEYFTAYPGSEKIPLKEVPGQGGMYTVAEDWLGIPMKPADIAIGKATADKRSSTLHEMSHHAAELEKRQPGTTPELAEVWAKAHGLTRDEAYRRTAGETEARTVQARRDLSAAERRERHPRVDEDRPREQQILLDPDSERPLTQAQQQKRPPADVWEVRQRGKGMMTPNGPKNTYDIYRNGERFTEMTITYNEKTKTAFFWSIGNVDPKTGAYVHLDPGHAAMIGIAKQYVQKFRPEAEALAGFRVGGSRELNPQETVIKVPRSWRLRSAAPPLPFHSQPGLPAEDPLEGPEASLFGASAFSPLGIRMSPGFEPDVVDDGDPGYAADVHIWRNAARRVEVVAVDDTGPIQMVTVKGLADEEFKLPLRGQGFGMTSVPTVGSIGYAYLANGRPDQAFLFGLEDPEIRPKGRAEGEVVSYGAPGQTIELNAAGDILIKTPGGTYHTNP